MDLNTEPIKNWFGFSRRERRSTFTLLLIVMLIIAFRYTIPESRITIEDITGTVSDTQNPGEVLNSPEAQMQSGPAVKEPVTRLSYSNKNNRGKFNQGLSLYQKPKIDLNTSDSASLVRLPGIGPVLSARIIKYRRLLGGFARIEQLKEVYGLPAETFEAIKDRVSADSTIINRININSADYKELSHIHYFERYEITAILKYRQIKGKISRITDLTENKLITTEKAFKVSPYLKFGD